jgi:ribonuclease HI
MDKQATVYTDGSCHTQLKVGAWVAIVLAGNEKHTISGTVTDTTNNAMELTAVIKAIEYIREKHPGINSVEMVADSQYVIGLTARREKLIAVDFTSKKGKELPNTALVKQFLNHTQSGNIQFIKIKAHQKTSELTIYNIEADKLARKLVRDAVNKTSA